MKPVNSRITLLVICLLSINAALAQKTQAKSGDSDTTIKRLSMLLNQSGKDYRVKIRITSRSKTDEHSVVYLKATRDADPQGDKLQFEISGKNTGSQQMCLKCSPEGTVSICDPHPGASIPALDAAFPGSILPWEEVLVGTCGNWVVEKNQALSTTGDQPLQDYQVRLVSAAFTHSWSNTLVTMDVDSKEPLYFDRVDSKGVVLRRIRVLEIGTTGSWRGIRRAVVEIPEGRVLMEVVSFRKGLGKSR